MMDPQQNVLMLFAVLLRIETAILLSAAASSAVAVAVLLGAWAVSRAARK